MNTIAFKNFRRYQDFPPIELNGVNFFVGENNSGKSTVVKAVILALQNTMRIIKGQDLVPFNQTPFYFDIPMTHVGSFRRAFCNSAIDNEMIFCFRAENDWYYEIHIDKPADLDSNLAFVHRLILSKDNYMMGLDLSKGLVELVDYPYNVLTFYQQDYELSEYQDIEPRHATYSVTSQINPEEFIYVAIKFLFSSPKNREGQTMFKFEHGDEKLMQDFSPDKIWSSISLNNPLVYLHAHEVSQQCIYHADDKSYVSDTIVSFAKISDQDKAQDFVLQWMHEFRIGVSFSIQRLYGDAYICEITEEDGTTIPLADKGVGTIQLMMLFMRVAVLITNPLGQYGLVVVEEPEQNLHPSFQAKLADFFGKVHESNRIQFLVETHSEYLIRRTQVLVAEWAKQKVMTDFGLKQLNDYGLYDQFVRKNPYRVYYFPKNDFPYDMEFQQNGKFAKPFGPGFMDIADQAAMDLYDLAED